MPRRPSKHIPAILEIPKRTTDEVTLSVCMHKGQECLRIVGSHGKADAIVPIRALAKEAMDRVESKDELVYAISLKWTPMYLVSQIVDATRRNGTPVLRNAIADAMQSGACLSASRIRVSHVLTARYGNEMVYAYPDSLKDKKPSGLSVRLFRLQRGERLMPLRSIGAITKALHHAFDAHELAHKKICDILDHPEDSTRSDPAVSPKGKSRKSHKKK